MTCHDVEMEYENEQQPTNHTHTHTITIVLWFQSVDIKQNCSCSFFLYSVLDNYSDISCDIIVFSLCAYMWMYVRDTFLSIDTIMNIYIVLCTQSRFHHQMLSKINFFFSSLLFESFGFFFIIRKDQCP